MISEIIPPWQYPKSGEGPLLAFLLLHEASQFS